eukprot:CAMPEP_0173443066 /NCGR_PEP_ID=MMETSP1357-20121228/28862_1 /TAXON_ID=77926 /ORGANISM="Hemiselmis rufescens, Strain PCC563" /LENGTH=94 /DNA_ID=CAMNT_0014408911 /DNA_START=30 /DNA_END=310 /DNA_ORIENTATION=-
MAEIITCGPSFLPMYSAHLWLLAAMLARAQQPISCSWGLSEKLRMADMMSWIPPLRPIRDELSEAFAARDPSAHSATCCNPSCPVYPLSASQIT